MENARTYEALFIVIPEKEETFEEMKESISSVISENKGDISGDNLVGKRKLAYPIKKKTEGIYYEVKFSAPPAAIIKMKRQFGINTDIMRTLIDRD